jgi:hypothetical protein
MFCAVAISLRNHENPPFLKTIMKMASEDSYVSRWHSDCSSLVTEITMALTIFIVGGTSSHAAVIRLVRTNSMARIHT